MRDIMISKQIPSSIDVMGVIYTIHMVCNLKNEATGDFVDGHVSYGRCSIDIEEELNPQIKWQTLMHEVIHIILMQTGRDNILPDEAVDALAFGLMATIKRFIE